MPLAEAGFLARECGARLFTARENPDFRRDAGAGIVAEQGAVVVRINPAIGGTLMSEYALAYDTYMGCEPSGMIWP